MDNDGTGWSDYETGVGLHEKLRTCHISDVQTTSALRSIAAQYLDSRCAADGTRAFPRSAGFQPLSAALATLSSISDVVTVRVCDVYAEPALTIDAKNAFTATILDSRRLALHVAHPGFEHRKHLARRTASADHIVVHGAQSVPCMKIRVDGVSAHVGEELMTLLADDRLDWKWIVRTPEWSLRMVDCGDRTHGRVRMYRSGVLWQEEPIEGFDVLIDVIGVPPVDAGELWLPPFPAIAHGSEPYDLAQMLLRPDRAVAISDSKLLKLVLRRAHPAWTEALWTRWWLPCYDDDMNHLLHLVKSDTTCDELLRFINVGEVIQKNMLPDDRLKDKATAICRRLGPRAVSQPLDYRGGIHVGIPTRFCTVPISSFRFVRCHDLGTLGCLGASHHGCIVPGKDDTACLVIPYDVVGETSRLAEAVASLCSLDGTSIGCGGRCEPEQCIYLKMDGVMSEASPMGCTDADHFTAYRLRLSVPDGVYLECVDAAEAGESLPARPEIFSVDELIDNTVNVSPFRVRSSELQRMFPALTNRLECQDNTSDSARIAACKAEAQARRLATEWSFRAWEDGGNLSSLGLSLLFATCLSGWAGAKVRVYLTPTRAAIVGVWKEHESRFVLYDPAKTCMNTFALMPRFSSCAESGAEVTLAPGDLIEVRVRPPTVGPSSRGAKEFQIARIVRLDESLYTADLSFVDDGSKGNISLKNDVWRAIGECTQSALKRFIKQEKKRGRESSDLT